MKNKQVIYSGLVLIGMTIGFFFIDEKFNEPMPWEASFFVTPVAFLVFVVFMSFMIILYSKKLSGCLYLFTLLFTLFAAGFGLGMVFQCLYLGQVAPTYFFIFFATIGYLLGFPVIQKFALWRYGSVF